MMLKYIIVALLFFAVPAGAQSGPTGSYLGGAFEASPRSEFGIGISIHGGYKWTQGWRAELEYRNSSDGFFDQSTTNSFLGNIWHDFESGWRLLPYVGGGIGFSHTSFDNTFGDEQEDDTGFSGQVGAGLQYPIFDKVVLDLGYRYFLRSGVEHFSDKHRLLFGAKYHF